MTSFTDEQWENFAFVISDDPKLASLMPQVNTVKSKSMPMDVLIPVGASGNIPLVREPGQSGK